MRVGFLHVGPDDKCVKIMVRTAKDVGYELVQMTDQYTPAIDGCEVRRLEWNGEFIMEYRMQHLALLSEPMLIVDTDIVFLDDVSDVWESDFDAALTIRKGPIFNEDGEDITIRMPYNCGVMFCRDVKFWQASYAVCKGLSDVHRNWYGDQLSIIEAKKGFDVLELPCEVFNCSPDSIDEVPEGARILHYKGKRKRWMIDIFAEQQKRHTLGVA